MAIQGHYSFLDAACQVFRTFSPANALCAGEGDLPRTVKRGILGFALRQDLVDSKSLGPEADCGPL
jgi:hypothetical protein